MAAERHELTRSAASVSSFFTYLIQRPDSITDSVALVRPLIVLQGKLTIGLFPEPSLSCTIQSSADVKSISLVDRAVCVTIDGFHKNRID